MKNKVRFVATFLMTFAVLTASGYYLFSQTFNSRLTRPAESQQIQAQNVAPTPTLEANALPAVETGDFGNPVSVSIPRVKVNVVIIDGTYINNEWALSEDKAHYAVMTNKPNDKQGNTLVYGHNNPKVFWNTKDLLPGDRMTIKTDKGYTLEYVFNSFELVVPTDTSVFKYQGKPRMTLLTCNGWNDQFRKLMYFNFLEATKENQPAVES